MNNNPTASVHTGTLPSLINLIHHNPDKEKTSSIEVETDSKNNDDLNWYISECRNRKYNWSESHEIIQGINSEDQFQRYFGIIGLRQLLNDEEVPFDEGRIQDVIDVGLLPKFLSFIQKDDEPQLQVEAIGALCGITGGSSDQVKEVVGHGAIPIIVKLLNSGQIELIEHVVATIANIATASPHRDILLDHDVLPPLIDVLKQALVKKDIALIRPGTGALSNLCRAKPLPAYERVADATSVFCTVVQEVTEIDILDNAIWALYDLSDSEHKVARVLETDVVPSLVRYLDYSDNSVVTATLRILGNIISQSDDQADVVLKGPSARSYIKKLFGLLKSRSDKRSIRREVCWSLSNITCQGEDFFDLVLGKTEYIEQLINATLYDVLDVQLEAVWALGNATISINPKQMTFMTRNGVFDCLCKVIQQNLPDEVMIIGLKGFQNYLEFGALMSRKQSTNNKYLIKMKQSGFIKKIKQLRESQSSEVSELTVGIWKKYLRVPLLRRKLKLKKAIICFKNERHSLFGLFQNKKKKLSV